MKQSEVNEAATLLRALLPLLVDAATLPTSDAAADLRRATGALSTNAAARILDATAISAMGDCFVYALNAGIGFDGWGRVRTSALLNSPSSTPAAIVLTSFVRLSLAWQSYLVATLEPKSRAEVDTYRDQLNASFEAAELAASDDGDHEGYRALVGLHAAVIRDLTTRARPLPRMLGYSLPATRPALWLANRLYGDGSRADELIAENRVIHPAFMPMRGRALSA
ncbi:hypothetical protein [Chelatococcus reniformis]|uniref:Mu-like prophage DNA circulation protein n=1 Tax=Chelatococcus reniformis TaxID=1494448 RepID=A0A916UVR6_9HYPH|nr:hypothetical protein [Chelatococcus reniformis]GGC90280.1 hypothetical protein GCM10010994_55150 [Chelatococcus reniformis]